MREVSSEHTAAWLSGEHTGANRPMQRATIQVMQMQTASFDKDLWSEYLFGQPAVPVELPNLQSIEWDRSVDADAATCKITLYNTRPLPLGTAVIPDDFGNYQYDQPGYYTFNRGRAATRWHHTPNEWQDLLVPDRLIRTYEGYGFNASVGPDFDPHMYQSGVWLIDDVEYGADDKIITLTCRDGGRLLIDQIVLPPVVPATRYPLTFTANDPHHADPPAYTVPAFHNATYADDSGSIYRGLNGAVLGHHPVDAFDTNPGTMWMSVGHATRDGLKDAEWIEATPDDDGNVAIVEFRTWGGPYVAYLSFKKAGAWLGSLLIPYNQGGGADNGSHITYSHKLNAPADTLVVWKLATSLTGVERVRVTLRQLYDSHVLDTGTGSGGPYRAGIRSFATAPTATLLPQTYSVVGDYADYSEIVKRLLGMGGFLWPASTSAAYQTMTDGSQVAITPPSTDPIIGIGRVWGDIQDTGTTGVPGTELGIDVWDKKPLMDGITYVRDIVGFNFFIDETGAGVFRTPNIWTLGNWVGDAGSGVAYAEGMGSLVTIDENETLISLTVKLSSRSQREKVFVSNTAGHIAAASLGRLSSSGPFDTGMRRVGGWTDQNFRDTADCQVMADLITLRQLFTYRTDRLEIPGNCAIQCDDQVRILEASTSEDFVHYVQAIRSSWNIEEGAWTYALDTHWLGDEPGPNWAFQTTDLSQETQDFIAAILAAYGTF